MLGAIFIFSVCLHMGGVKRVKCILKNKNCFNFVYYTGIFKG